MKVSLPQSVSDTGYHLSRTRSAKPLRVSKSVQHSQELPDASLDKITISSRPGKRYGEVSLELAMQATLGSSTPGLGPVLNQTLRVANPGSEILAAMSQRLDEMGRAPKYHSAHPAAEITLEKGIDGSSVLETIQSDRPISTSPNSTLTVGHNITREHSPYNRDSLTTEGSFRSTKSGFSTSDELGFITDLAASILVSQDQIGIGLAADILGHALLAVSPSLELGGSSPSLQLSQGNTISFHNNTPALNWQDGNWDGFESPLGYLHAGRDKTESLAFRDLTAQVSKRLKTETHFGGL